MTLKFSHVVAKNTPKGKAADKFAELARAKSGGRIDVQVFANSELYKDADEVEALQKGTIHFIAPGNGKFGPVAPQWDATGLPYLLNSEAAVGRLLDPDNPVARELFEALRPKGLLGLAMWANGWKHFINTERPLKTPADFQGLKFGVTNKPDEAFVKALGAGAQTLPSTDIFGVMQLGGLAGTYHTWSNIASQKYHEITRYATISRGGEYLTYAVATNAGWWDGLDADSKKILAEALKEATVYERQLSDKENADALTEIKKSGRLELYEQTEADVKAFQQAAEKVISDYEQKTGRDIIDKLKAMN
jgi:C4-dicarboxylate-binding protein DctP